jgi:RNA polymerase sigma factor (sigma-70 family)
VPTDPDPESSRWFAEEILPHEAKLRSWLRARFPSVTDPDDLVQEAYARLMQAHATGPIACPRAFLFVTARNIALNHLRHQRIERPDGAIEIDALSVADERAGIPEALAQAEDFQILIRAIQALPARCRQIVTLRKIYGLSQKEVAVRLGIAEHTVEAQGGIGLRRVHRIFPSPRLRTKNPPMKPVSPNHRDPAAIAREAAQWVLRRDRGLTASEQDDLMQWLAADPRHREALALHRWGWDELDRLTGLQTSLGAVPDPDLFAPRVSRRAKFLRWFAPLTLGLAAAAVVMIYLSRARSVVPVVNADIAVPAAPALAAPCERQTLPDGSVVELNRGASIEVAFTAAKRRVKLVRGEANFIVEKNPARPFIVNAAGVDVRAVGTVFNVRLGRAAVEVVVSEGRVKVEPPAAAAEQGGAFVSVGQRAVVPLDGRRRASRRDADRAGTRRPPRLAAAAARLHRRTAPAHRRGVQPSQSGATGAGRSRARNAATQRVLSLGQRGGLRPPDGVGLRDEGRVAGRDGSGAGAREVTAPLARHPGRRLF